MKGPFKSHAVGTGRGPFSVRRDASDSPPSRPGRKGGERDLRWKSCQGGLGVKRRPPRHVRGSREKILWKKKSSYRERSPDATIVSEPDRSFVPPWTAGLHSSAGGFGPPCFGRAGILGGKLRAKAFSGPLGTSGRTTRKPDDDYPGRR